MSPPTLLRPAAARQLLRSSRQSQSLPTFLLPSLCTPIQHQQTSPFTTSPSAQYPRDMNRERGVSTKRRTGLRTPVSVSKIPLPKPVLDASKRSPVVVDPNHGLYQFFHSKDKPLNTPEEDASHGRNWTVEELRAKSWEDLHALWWVCAKERNRIATADFERARLGAGYGDYESETRDDTVRKTQKSIKQVLTERYYSWQDAQEVAKSDGEVNLSGEGPAYTPSDYLEEEEVSLEEAKAPETRQ